MKPGSVYRVRISTKDYRSLLDLLDKAGVDTEENSDILAGLTLSILLEVFRKADIPKEGRYSEILESFIREAQYLRAVWNVSGTSTQQDSYHPLGPMVGWPTQALRDKLVELEKYRDLPGAIQTLEKIQAILRNRESPSN
jgi:hypothetical protein